MIKLSRREWLGGLAAIGAMPLCRLGAAPTVGTITPEQFGAVGDGLTNDTAAFAKMSAFVNRRGGGQIVLRPTTYIVGQQSANRKSNYAFAPAPILELSGCTQPVMILGNGARLRCADGLRFGTFDQRTGQPTFHEQPYYGMGETASPYIAMISIQNCEGDIYVENVELDGNVAGLQIGGPWGDTGWQIPATGIYLAGNTGDEQILRVRSHHHALDGMIISGVAQRTTSSLLSEVVAEHNGRQGCSLVGGRNYSFVDCRFNHTGRAGLASAPGAGLDIEAESPPIRNLSFSGCEFSNNFGCGLLADSGDSEGATFNQCRFIGTTNWAAWPGKPYFGFTNCDFVGAIVNTFGDPDPQRAAQFESCTFLDDPALSPTGQVYRPLGPIADLSSHENILFNRCNFRLTRDGLLPWSINAIYVDTVMSQTAANQAYPRGTYRGTNRIDGNVDLYGSTIIGELTVNGQIVPPNA
jgi:hypothetical protein